MQKRIRPITYAESLQAKEFAENNDTEIIEETKEPEGRISLEHIVTSSNSINIETLPSKGLVYPKNSEVYITPFSFGEMKFLSGSNLNDIDNIVFFLKKIQTTFPKEDLTYYDFYFLTVLIKMSTFGDVDYTMTFECPHCNHINKIPFKTSDLEFYDIKVPFPITIDLKTPYINTETGLELLKVSFVPVSVGRYKKMIDDETTDDMDIYIANCIIEGTEEDRIKIIKEYLNGADVNLLETIDVVLFHGVKDLHLQCQNKITPEDGVEEVCGRIFDLPFRRLSEHISSTSELEESIGQRIHFGL